MTTDDLRAIKDELKRHSSTARPAAFAAWAESLTARQGEAFWTALKDAWPGFDAIDYPRYCRLFKRFKASRPALFVDHLPEQITIFRGQDASSEIGLAWTTDPAVAEGFSEGHRGIYHDDPVVYQITVGRDDVAFTFDDRDESEIVLLRMTQEMIREALTS